MSRCIVYVYDDNLSAVTSQSIEIREFDAWWKILDIKLATSLGPDEFGAQLTLPEPPEPIVIWVDDLDGYFAPTSLAHLNGKQTARLDITLYALPVPPTGRKGGRGRRGGLRPPPRSGEPSDAGVLPTDFIARQINQEVQRNNWSDSEALAVQSLADTVVRAMSWSKLDPEMKGKVSRWVQKLESLDIAVTSGPLFAPLWRQDSQSREVSANRGLTYDQSGYGRRQERWSGYEYGSRPSDYPHERERYGSRQERDSPYGRGGFGVGQERDSQYARDRYGAGRKSRYRSDYDYEDEHDRYGSSEERGWWDRASDEVAGWFGDEEAERRHRMDQQREQYRGRGPKGYRRSDERIREDVNDRLSDDYFLDASDLEVTVANGELTLTGTVSSRNDKRRAEDIAESVAGVTNVENRLRVRQGMVEAYSGREYGSTGSAETTRASGTASATAPSETTQTRAVPSRGRTET